MICYNASKNQIYYTSKQMDILLKSEFYSQNCKQTAPNLWQLSDEVC